MIVLFLFSRANDSALRTDQQEWGTPCKELIPSGHCARGSGCTRALLRRPCCFVRGIFSYGFVLAKPERSALSGCTFLWFEK